MYGAVLFCSSDFGDFASASHTKWHLHALGILGLHVLQHHLCCTLSVEGGCLSFSSASVWLSAVPSCLEVPSFVTKLLCPGQSRRPEEVPCEHFARLIRRTSGLPRHAHTFRCSAVCTLHVLNCFMSKTGVLHVSHRSSPASPTGSKQCALAGGQRPGAVLGCSCQPPPPRRSPPFFEKRKTLRSKRLEVSRVQLLIRFSFPSQGRTR